MTSLHKIAIVGAGLAGLACADRLKTGGHEVRLFDKGRGPGGRMSTRRVTIGDVEVGFDHGAQYFTARDPAFLAQVKAWQKQGLVTPWRAAGEDAWVGTPAMNAPIANLSARHKVQFSSRVDGVVRSGSGWRLQGADIAPETYGAVVIAVPAEQVSALVIDSCPGFALSAKATPSSPCWTIMVAFDRRLEIEADILRSDGEVVWAARNSSKPGRAPLETWVVQASADWSLAHRGAGHSEVIVALLTSLRRLAGQTLPDPVFVQAHSWLYARSGSNGYGYLWDQMIGIGVCGDWLVGPRVECAWLSGNALARHMISAFEALVP